MQQLGNMAVCYGSIFDFLSHNSFFFCFHIQENNLVQKSLVQNFEAPFDFVNAKQF